ncbi:hypothetical protein, partial [Sphingorhabdus sp.]|uniref:hypothetical protein n=1 Tax=Sphingorhabdus sp. TaxID=1902408 RepID=UPI0025E5166C
MTGVGVTKYRTWALQNIGLGQHKTSCKRIEHEGGDLGGLFLYPTAPQFIADTQYFGHAMCVFMRRAKQKAW